ncbi:MAG: hypothetical protein EXS63_09445 [Candidatus Omnitrophica bacterium]|nr:hypothetical protein [Candidatus Omnitrophota bacterium]
MKKQHFVLFLIVALSVLSPIARAAETVWDMAESDQYGKKVGGQLGRGLLNVATCFVDVISQTVDGTKHGTPFVGTLTGLGGGIACTALRVTSGALDVATFWVPGFNGIPVSRKYTNCLDFGTEAAPQEVPQATYTAPVARAEAAAPAEPQHSPMDYVKK